MIGFGIYDTFLDTGSKFVRIAKKLINDSGQYLKDTFLENTDITLVLWGLVFFLIIYISLFAYLSYQKSINKKGKIHFLSILIPHFLVNILDMFFTVIILYSIGFSVYLITGQLVTDGNYFVEIESQVVYFYNEKIPTIVNMPYLLAIFFTIIFTDLPGYFLHWLTHKSRFLWYVVHRSHHTAEIMHPMGTGPVYGFGFLLGIPRFFITLAVSKFIYEEPLVIEMLVFYFFYILVEKFNHASPFYDFAYRNKLVRYVSAFYGSGVYHYTHHSAREGEESVNIAGSFFNFWDRVFGTFVKPRKEKPAIGLTNQPDIILNPITLYFSGLLTIGYELRNNSIKHWFNIIFGTVSYAPPQTKDYLITAYNKPPIK
ncbi:sterol desaturase family protein [Aquimarina sp. 2304DJ70-9]|uniref:sterol desaturase family protein n=1 Tax=Aquimarina penaris TaxID=3231044 RepID=UPI003461D633